MYFEYFAKSWSKPRETQSSTAESTRPPHLEALLVGFAMVARGEIGFLIASLSQSSGTLLLKNQQNTAIVSGEAVFLVIVWAVVICTIVGPVVVGILVRRIRNQALDLH